DSCHVLAPAGLGVATTAQRPPSPRTTNGRWVSPGVVVMPTATQLFAVAHETDVSSLVYGGTGAAAVDHFVPSQRSMRGIVTTWLCASSFVIEPAVTQLVADTQSMPAKVAFRI